MLLLYVVVVVVVDKNLTRAHFPWSNVWLQEFGNITYYFWFDSIYNRTVLSTSCNLIQSLQSNSESHSRELYV